MKIYVTRPVPDAGLKLLRNKGYEVVVNEDAADRAAIKDEMVTALKAGGFDGILSVLTDKIDGEIMDAAGSSLKVVANFAVGYDNLDVKTAQQKNIACTNTPGVLTDTVAEHTFALLLSIAHRIAEADKFSRAGMFKIWGPKLLLGVDISGKTLGVVGLGRIGSRVAYHAVKGFGMKVVYTDQKPNPDFEKEFNAKYAATVDELLPQADFVSLHVPMNDSTKHLINEARLKLMKPTAFLINTARGPVVDEAALVEALSSGIIRGAALDVFEFEPKISPELMKLDNVILTPHIASATEATRDKMAEMAAINIIEVLEGRTPPNLIK